MAYAQRVGETCRHRIGEAVVGRIYKPLLKFLRVNDCSCDKATDESTHRTSDNVS